MSPTEKVGMNKPLNTSPNVSFFKKTLFLWKVSMSSRLKSRVLLGLFVVHAEIFKLENICCVASSLKWCNTRKISEWVIQLPLSILKMLNFALVPSYWTKCKVLVLVYKALYNLGARYFKDCLILYICTRSLHSAGEGWLLIPFLSEGSFCFTQYRKRL